MKIDISLNTTEFDKLSKKLEPSQYVKILQNGIDRMGGLAENRLGLESSKTVYSYVPKTNKYVRTGRLLGGRVGVGSGLPSKVKIDKNTIKIEANPMLKGADYNYAPDVNKGTGLMKRVGPRPFFDNALKWLQTSGLKIAVKEIKENINKKLK